MKLAAFAPLALLALAPDAQAQETCLVKAVIGGKPVEMKHCAIAVYDEKGVTLFFSATPIGDEEKQMFQLNSYPKDTGASQAGRRATN